MQFASKPRNNMRIDQAGLYAATLALSVTAIVGVVKIGASLFDPAALSGLQRASAIGTQSMLDALLQNLAGNLGHPFSRVLVQLLLVIAACRLLAILFLRLGMPAVVGQMSAGVLLGPSFLGVLAPGAFGLVFPVESLDALRLFSQLGICLFMFSVGMELNVSCVRNKAAAAVAVSHASIAFPFLLGVLLAYLLFGSMAGPNASFTSFALFMGTSISITAFPVLARILQERGLSRTPLGSTAITCAAVDDVTAWSILAFVVATANASSMSAAALTLALALLFAAVMTLGVRPALTFWLRKHQLDAEEPLDGTLIIVVGVLMAAALYTEVIGIHALFGAFLAGAVMPTSSEFRHRISVRLEKFSSVLLLPVFFAITGLRTEIGLLDSAHDWLVCLAIVFIATLGKLGGTALAARVVGMNWRESLQLGALMNTRGLMELIALNIGYDLGIISARIFTMLVVMAVITTMMTGPLLTLLGVDSPRLARPREPSAA